MFACQWRLFPDQLLVGKVVDHPQKHLRDIVCLKLALEVAGLNFFGEKFFQYQRQLHRFLEAFIPVGDLFFGCGKGVMDQAHDRASLLYLFGGVQQQTQQDVAYGAAAGDALFKKKVKIFESLLNESSAQVSLTIKIIVKSRHGEIGLIHNILNGGCGGAGIGKEFESSLQEGCLGSGTFLHLRSRNFRGTLLCFSALSHSSTFLLLFQVALPFPEEPLTDSFMPVWQNKSFVKLFFIVNSSFKLTVNIGSGGSAAVYWFRRAAYYS